MKSYKADLHVHTVLSPCGDLDMSPVRIIKEAKEKHLDIIGVTDHNSTLHCKLIKELGDREGIFVLPGCEVNTAEEVHCLAFFEDIDTCNKFQGFIDKHLPDIKNKPELFGYQVVVNEEEEIIQEIDALLISAIKADINAVAAEVYRLNGIFIPAHIERQSNGILHQLGFLPTELNYDALEISYRTKKNDFLATHPELKGIPFTTSSDAHYPGDIARATTTFKLSELSFRAIKQAFQNPEKYLEIE